MLGRSDTRKTTVYSRSSLPVQWAVPQAVAAANTAATGAAKGGGKGAPAPAKGAAAAAAVVAVPVPVAAVAVASGAEVIAQPPDFVIWPTSGVLEPLGSVEITVTFRARVRSKPLASFAIEVQDTLGLCGVTQSASVALAAEAYAVELSAVFGGGAAGVYDGLDFGLCRVVDEKSNAFELVNAGPYDVGYEVRYKRRAVESVLSISQTAPPQSEEGQQLLVPAGGRVALLAKFRSEAETLFEDTADVRIHFSEPLTGEALAHLTLPLKLRVRSVFSRYAL
ncbi:hypothetical protein T492DRAFT_894811, partial [Pavlovales sp. CCMP2436]